MATQRRGRDSNCSNCNLSCVAGALALSASLIRSGSSHEDTVRASPNAAVARSGVRYVANRY